MQLHGKNYLGFQESALGGTSFYGIDPARGENLETPFTEATSEEVNSAVAMAVEAFKVYKNMSGEAKAKFLETIADEIMNLGDRLVQRACAETALPEGRIIGERGRTMGQLRLFAELVREGSWVDARIDEAIPDRQPLPRVDIRSMLRPLGPVAVFGASNFPLAFSVAGGDTASALAAGCPVIVKAHPAHPGTSELVAFAIVSAAKKTGMPDGVFSMVHGISHEVGTHLVSHKAVKAVGFTGSLKGGRALFDIASKREEPIPVYAEMGSTNPVFVLPGAMSERGEEISKQLHGSFTLGVGQFCTNPGVVFMQDSADVKDFEANLSSLISASSSETMLTSGIHGAFCKGVENLASQEGVEVLARSNENGQNQGRTCLLSTKGETFLENAFLEEEVFGPSTLLVHTSGADETLKIASGLHGHLTATILGTEEDLQNNVELIQILEEKVGRLLINGFPTGVEVCNAMVHGGPYPATTDARSTSVGTKAIERFVRQTCYQNFPDSLLPDELKTDNPLKINRLINGEQKG
ncbi:aldehyde dehydrogenase (NADP(+)) [Flagellimonas nanhaiensis]|uniref:2,5-dioxovalerate dehydrogenase n=1 Tax=Flagellimonas nanhaiensis TaxID=2292706 RepID=A0A371JMA0_9FLAO|nr:aldehyde dehydrogenase (NADP(+)) [Allomuricauda nanhaiensis]RDY58189.1 aldehyde dehydrogenase (NADP(+)) [Allomuricauda nanhaiensis]